MNPLMQEVCYFSGKETSTNQRGERQAGFDVPVSWPGTRGQGCVLLLTHGHQPQQAQLLTQRGSDKARALCCHD